MPQQAEVQKEAGISIRTDFIRSAIRSQLDKHAAEVQQSIARQSWSGRFQQYTCRFPTVQVEVLESVKGFGIFQACEDVKAALEKSGRIQ